MSSLLLSLLIALQGIPLQSQQTGTISGVLKDTAGKPIAGIRMAAVAKPEAINDTSSGSAMASIAETDSEGRYTLENIPPGRYFVAAGRVDMQTYFPGTQKMATAKEVAIVPGTKIGGIDFALDASSSGRAMTGLNGQPFSTAVPANVTIPIDVTVEGGGAWPVSGNGKITNIVITSANGGCCSPAALSRGGVTVTTAGGAYQVTLENLPKTFVVKAMTYGSTDLLKDTLKLTSGNVTSTALTIYQASNVMTFGTSSGPQTPPSTILVTLARVTPPQNTAGVSVSGSFNVPGGRTLFLSGVPGNTYSNNTFDVFGVPPGRHILATRDNPYSSTALGASVVVGNRDLTEIDLGEIAAVPKSAWEPAPALAAKDHSEGLVPLARVRGTALEEQSQKPLTNGDVVIRGFNNYGRTVPLDNEGHFEIPNLLPGSYEIEIHVSGHSNTTRSVVIDDEDLTIDLTSRRLF
jgi:hypothetical protein